MSTHNFDLTPAPNVLIALTQTPLLPLDALCELIDNALDSFTIAERQGAPVTGPCVMVALPKKEDVSNGTGILRVQDNGPGMTSEMAGKALKAGFSSNNPFDTLGLFGMGFNIATGKLGRTTRLLTARKDEEQAIEVSFNLQQLVESGNYEVPVTMVPKPFGLVQGTMIDVENWWPEGHPNFGFIYKLIKYGRRKLREELGRRYATILRRQKVQIFVDSEPCTAFEHCHWSDARFVTRDGSQIPAVFRFDAVVGTQKRCTSCSSLVPPESPQCVSCTAAGFRTVEERVKGWVGIQRFDDENNYGIDLIRNGRTIRVSEQSAFFYFIDEAKRQKKDYPADSNYGRIIGEVELNHVPVDFMKQDFQRSSSEWQRALVYLRGESSLWPGQLGADRNESPVYKLFQGYRRVRTPGKTDLYMGFWDPEVAKPKRISREVERDYFARFMSREPGFFDDSEWYKRVQQADQPPPQELVSCPNCHSQNIQGMDTCAACGYVLIGKKCLNRECGQNIPESAVVCPHCGTPQIPPVETPWQCNLCKSTNFADATNCSACGAIRGGCDPLSREYLIANSSLSDELSLPGASIELPDGSKSGSINIKAYIVTGALRAHGEAKSLPLVVHKGEQLEIFIDTAHALYRTMHISPEVLIASEAAQWICDANRRFSGGRFSKHFSLSNVQWTVLNSFWVDRLADGADKIKAEIKAFLREFIDKYPSILKDQAGTIFESLNEDQQRQLINNFISSRKDLSSLNVMIANGSVLAYLDQHSAIGVFRTYADHFFNGKFWNDGLGDEPAMPATMREEARSCLTSYYLNLLEDAVSFLSVSAPPAARSVRARQSLQLLQEKRT